MAFNYNLTGSFVYDSDPKTGHFSCSMNIPTGWIIPPLTPLLFNSVFSGFDNTLTFTSTKIDFPNQTGISNQAGSSPSTPATLNSGSITVSTIKANTAITVVVQGQNTNAAGDQKSGTVTTTLPPIKR